MQRGAIRSITWTTPRQSFFAKLRIPQLFGLASLDAGPDIADATSPTANLVPAPTTAEEEAIKLLRIAAEVEGALMAQYLFTAESLKPGFVANAPGFPTSIRSDDWYRTIFRIAKQEMGHLITVQNLLLSLNDEPHLDRENFPQTSPLFPFPFSLQPAILRTLAKYVCAEAPRNVQIADQADFGAAQIDANSVVGQVSRVGKIYERLFWLFQDSDAPQTPWLDLVNPFPNWPNWHVDSKKAGMNQDRQAQPDDWLGDPVTGQADVAIYVIQITDKDSARRGIYALGSQGEGPVNAPGVSHFDKFLRIYREMRAVGAGEGDFSRHQAPEPSTGLGSPANITDPSALAWAKLSNTRYQMLLTDIALSVAIGSTGSAPSTTATSADFRNWAFTEMKSCIKPLADELRELPLTTGAAPDQPRAGIPFELPNQDLPTVLALQLDYLRARIAESRQLRATIQNTFNPTTRQMAIFGVIENFDVQIEQGLGP